MIANVKAWLPDEAKCLVWYGYGAPDSTYIVPLWPTMKKLPELYVTGNRYEEFRRDSGWWTNSYVQQVARINYQSAIKDLHDFRNPKLATQYKVTEEIQNTAANLIRAGKKAEAIRPADQLRLRQRADLARRVARLRRPAPRHLHVGQQEDEAHAADEVVERHRRAGPPETAGKEIGEACILCGTAATPCRFFIACANGVETYGRLGAKGALRNNSCRIPPRRGHRGGRPA